MLSLNSSQGHWYSLLQKYHWAMYRSISSPCSYGLNSRANQEGMNSCLLPSRVKQQGTQVSLTLVGNQSRKRTTEFKTWLGMRLATSLCKPAYYGNCSSNTNVVRLWPYISHEIRITEIDKGFYVILVYKHLC